MFKRKNRKARRAILRDVREQYAQYVEDGGELTFWEWLWENREQILEFILKIIALFSAL